MAIKRNVVKVDLCSYPPYMLLAPKKFGKTTFWYNLVRDVWGDDSKGLLVSFGNEEGYHSLDGIQVEVAKDWNSPEDEETGLRGFTQIVDDLIDNNHKYGIRGVCFDTLDTMVGVATAEVLRQHKKEKKTECKSLMDAFSGYGRGKQRLFEIMDKQIERLREAGFAVFFLCHVKHKEKTDLLSGEKYEMLSNNLTDDIFSHFADAAQMVMVGAIDREIVNGKIINEERVLWLRGTSSVDAGSRFTDLPEKIGLSPKEFMQAFEHGVKHSMADPSKMAEQKKIEEKERETKAAKAKVKDQETRCEEEFDRDVILQAISSKFSGQPDSIKEQAKAMLNDAGFSKFTDPEIPVTILNDIANLMQ